jgi:RND family efflux transporter MFP subunit
MAELGRSVDGQVLFRIAADNRLEVSAQIAEGDVLALQEGQRATFTLVDGSTVDADLRRLPASIDSRTRTGEALFSLPQGTRVRAGMYLRGHADLPAREVIAVPQSSVLYDSGQAYVYVVDDTSHVQRVDIQLGGRDGDWVEVVMGLDPNQRIVGSGAAFVQNGDEVRVLQTPAPAAEEPATNIVGPSEDIRGREG